MHHRPRPPLRRTLAVYGVLAGLWVVPPGLAWPALVVSGSRPAANPLAWPLAAFEAALDGSAGLEPWRWLAAAPPHDVIRFWAFLVLEAAVLAGASWVVARQALGTGRPLPTASRWARPWDLRRAGLVVRGASSLRLILGRLGVLGFVATRPGVSVLVFGPTGSGKSAGVCVPQILEWDGPVVAVSIKNDLVVQTAGHRQRVGRTDVFDPTGITRLGTCTWSPVSRCEDFDRALRVGQWLVQGQNGYAQRDAEWEHWEDAAIRLVTTALYAGASLGAPIAEVLSWLDDVSGGRLGSALAAVPARDRRALQWYHSVQERPDRERGSCYSTSQKVLRPYIEQQVAASADGESFDPREFLRSGSGTLYLVAPQSEQARLSGVFTSLVMTLMTDAADIAQSRPDGRLPRPLLMMLDECANTAPIRELPQYLSTVRSMGITVVAIFQDLAQCEGRYGELASSIVNNARAVLFLSGSKDRKTLELLRDLTGRQRQRRYTQDNSGGEQMTFEKDEMLPVDLGRRLGPGRGVLLYEHLPPVVLRMRNCYEDRDLRRHRTRQRFIPGVTEVVHSTDVGHTPTSAAAAFDP
jgi:type IV secretion system protein VirD4